MQVTPLNFERKDETIIASILPEGWNTTVGGELYTFPPFKQFRVSVEDGAYLLEKAKQDFADRAEQRRGERNMWARKISSMNQVERDRALRFCDVDGNPLSKEIPIVPLVNLSTKAGQEAYQKAYDAAKKSGKKPDYIATKVSGLDLNMGFVPNPDAGDITRGESRKFRSEAYDSSDVVPPLGPLPPATAQAQVEQEAADEGGKLTPQVERPKPEWAEDKLVKYALSKGFSVTAADKKDPSRVLEIAIKAHEQHLKRLTAGGAEFVET